MQREYLWLLILYGPHTSRPAVSHFSVAVSAAALSWFLRFCWWFRKRGTLWKTCRVFIMSGSQATYVGVDSIFYAHQRAKQYKNVVSVCAPAIWNSPAARYPHRRLILHYSFRGSFNTHLFRESLSIITRRIFWESWFCNLCLRSKTSVQSINHALFFRARPKVDQRAGQLGLPHVGIN